MTLWVVFRSYFSRTAVGEQHHPRTAILEPGPVHPGDVVGRFQAGLAAGDIEAVVGTFEPDGYYREAIGPPFIHRGASELGSYFARCFSDGGIGLRHCAVTDDGVRCAVEYNCVRWGGHELAPQAGIGVHERGPGRLLAGVRVYDDVELPAGQPRWAAGDHLPAGDV